MKAKLLFLVKYYLYWLVLSITAKVFFLLYQWKDSATLTGSDIWHIFAGGLQLDFSLGGYILMLSAVILIFSVFLQDKVIRSIFSVLTLILLVFFCGVAVIDLEIFRNWGYHLDSTPLMYLKTPQEAMASTPVWLSLSLLLFMVVWIAVSWWIYRQWIGRILCYQKGHYWEMPVFLLLGGVMIIPVRGGFNVAPMNSSFVFFHPKNMYANEAAINPVWNFMYELMHINRHKKSFAFMAPEKARQVVDSLMVNKGDYPRLLKEKRPNVVFILLESFTANAIESLGGVPGITPNLDTLAKEGVLFSNIYATGSRSDRGMVAAISGLPSHPGVAIIRYPNKMVEFPRFPKDFEAEGYATRYYYAGDINFGNFRSYVTMSFQDMVTEDDFSGEAIRNRFKWGVHDEYMLDRLYEDILKAPRPFMYMAFNMSSHEPFKVPGEVTISGNDTESMFLNAIHYSDRCIGDFIRKCKASGVWENTLFIFMADHGTRHIKHVNPSTPQAYHIPLILTGGVLNVRDTVITTIGSQTDMIATVLAQLEMDHSHYRYSRNLLAGQLIPFAFYSYPSAAGVISEQGTSILDLQAFHYMEGDSIPSNDEALKAFLQIIDAEVHP